MKTCQVRTETLVGSFSKGFVHELCGKPAIESRVVEGQRILVCLYHKQKIDGESKK